MMEPGFSYGAQYQEMRRWSTGGSPLSPPGSTATLCRWQSTGTNGPERLWGLPPWRSSNATWTGPGQHAWGVSARAGG